MEDLHETTPGAGSPDTHADIYGEDGVIRASFLAHIGAAIADRDTLALKKEVDGLHQSELGDLLDGAAARAAPCAGRASRQGFRLLVAHRGRRGDPPRHRRQSAQRADRSSRAGTRFRRRGLHSRRPRPGGPGRDPGAAAFHRAHQAAPLARLSGRERRPAHADRVRRGAAFLDGRADHRLHARRPEPARPFQPDLRHRPDLQAARRDRPRPGPAHQARGQGRGHHARDAACDPGDDGPGRGRARVRAVRPSVRRRRRRERAAGRRADHRRRGRRHPAGGRGGPSAHGRRRRRGTVRHRVGHVALARAVAAWSTSRPLSSRPP